MQVPLPQLLRARMAERGLNQAQLARELDVSPSQVSRWLDGGGLSFERIPAVAGFLGIDESELFAAVYSATGIRRRALESAANVTELGDLLGSLAEEARALRERVALLEERFAQRVQSSDQRYDEFHVGLRALREELESRRRR